MQKSLFFGPCLSHSVNRNHLLNTRDKMQLRHQAKQYKAIKFISYEHVGVGDPLDATHDTTN